MQLDETVALHNISDTGRVRADMGDVASLAASIKEFGVIQPIVLNRSTDIGPITLVAGGRRLAALRSLGVTELTHGKEFIWREEEDSPSGKIRLQAIELEENLKRKDLAWSEVILGKKRLLTLMQDIHGPALTGRGNNEGFGVRSLASMLGENPSTTSRDLELAGFVEKHPTLAAMPNAADARRKLGVAITVAAMQGISKIAALKKADADAAASAAGRPAPVAESDWTLYEGAFQANINNVGDDSVDLICTDLPYNIGLGTSTAAHSAGLGSFSDSDLDIVGLCRDVARESFRTLRPDRFAVFFYGMNYHEQLRVALEAVGFTVDPYPFIWLRDRTAPPDGFARYSKTYDPAFIASKGKPRFVRPNLPNTLAVPSVRGPERLHAAQKPVTLMQKFIEDMTTPGCTVLDMFAGAGSTGVATLQTKRKTILFELESANCVLIRARLGAIKP